MSREAVSWEHLASFAHFDDVRLPSKPSSSRLINFFVCHLETRSHEFPKMQLFLKLLLEQILNQPKIDLNRKETSLSILRYLSCLFGLLPKYCNLHMHLTGPITQVEIYEIWLILQTCENSIRFLKMMRLAFIFSNPCVGVLGSSASRVVARIIGFFQQDCGAAEAAGHSTSQQQNSQGINKQTVFPIMRKIEHRFPSQFKAVKISTTRPQKRQVGFQVSPAPLGQQQRL